MSNQNNGIERYKQIAKGLTPSVHEYKEVEAVIMPVEVDVLPKGLVEYTEEEYYAIENTVTANGKSFPEDITLEKFRAYCMYCIMQRVKWVRNERPDFRPQDNLIFPSLLAVISENVGEVTADREALVIRPVITKETEDYINANITKPEVERISRFLEKSVPGYQGSKGYVKSKIGVADYMLMQVVQGIVSSTRHDSHPVYALLADILGIKIIDSALNPTQKYGESVYFGALMSQLTTV